MAITWRNVDAPNTAGTLAALSSAAKDISGAFGGLQNTVRQVELAGKEQNDRIRADNTNAFLNQLHGFTDVEQLEAAIKDGSLNRQASAYGNMVNQDQLRGAAEQRLAALRQNTTAANQFEDQLRDRADNDLMQKAMAHVAGGGKSADVLESLKGTRKYGDYAKVLQDAERGNIRFEWDAENHTWGIRQKQANINQSNAAAAASSVAAQGGRIRNEIAGLELKDLKDTRTVDALVSAEAAAHQQRVQGVKDKFNELARLNKDVFPVDAQGNFDPTAIKPENRKAIEVLAEQNGISLDTLLRGDTNAHRSVVQKLQSSGVSGKALEAVNKAGNLFNTSPAAPIGNDAASADRAAKLTSAMDKAITEAAGGVPSTLENVNTLLATKLQSQLIDKDRAGQIQRVTNDWVNGLKGGIDVGGGRKVFPNEEMIINALNAVSDDNMYLSDGNIKSALKKLERDFRGAISEAKRVQDKVK